MASYSMMHILVGYFISICTLFKLSDARMLSSISRIYDGIKVQDLFSSASSERFEASTSMDIDSLDYNYPTDLGDIDNLNFPLAPTLTPTAPEPSNPIPSFSPTNQPPIFQYPAAPTPSTTTISPPPSTSLPPPPSNTLPPPPVSAPYPSVGQPQSPPSLGGAGAPEGHGRGFEVWCVAKPTVPDPMLQRAMDYACGFGDGDICKEIQPNGPCFDPNSLISHASFAFNSYWQKSKSAGGTCDFGGTAMLITVDPSFKECHFVTDNNP